MNAFDLLHPLIRGVLPKLGYREPTKVQELAIPVVLKGRHTLISSPTGTGKTEAAVLPVLSNLLNSGNLTGIRVLYITPARALNRDLEYRIRRICESIGLRVAVRHGDTPQSERERQRRNPPQFLITTPETLQILLASPIMRSWLRSVRWVIVDEVHEMLGSKRGIQLAVALERLVELSGEFQRIALSATIGDLELASRLIGGVDRPVEIVSVNDISRGLEVAVHYVGGEEFADVVSKASDTAIKLSEGYKGSILLFTNTRDMAELLGTSLMGKMGSLVEVYHGSLSRTRRESIEERLRRGEVKVVVTTSSLELGIDIGAIDAVIQFSSPRQVDRLIQRVGRSEHTYGGIARGHILALTLDDYLESMVISRMAKAGELEGDYPYHEGALDVLTHQLAGIVLDHGNSVSVNDAYNLVKRAHPYSKLSYEDFLRVLEFMDKTLRLIKLDNETIRARRGLKMYYIQNASMIPDEAKFTVASVVDNEQIGELDEDFVSTLEPGKVIVLAGRLWRVVNVDKAKGIVQVEPTAFSEGSLPEWIGDEIPVSFKVARLVCGEREVALKHGVNLLGSGGVKLADLEKVAEEASAISKDLDGYVPGLGNIVVEQYGNITIVHACLGTKGNEALGLYLTGYLIARQAMSIEYIRDAYRVIIKSPRPIGRNIIVRALSEDFKEVEETVKNAIKNNTLYKYRFIQVARRMGVLPKGNVDVNISRLIKVYSGTPLDEETIREIIVDKLDMDALRWLIEGVRSGSVKLTFVERRPSKLALMIMGGVGARAMMGEEVPVNIIVDSVKRRIMNREVTLLCLRCGWSMTAKVSSLISMELKCPKCGARTLTVLKYRDEDVEEARRIVDKARRGLPLTRSEAEYLEELRSRAWLIMDHGWRGLVAISAHGVGAATARRILSNASNEDELYELIVEAEREYIRTRSFWAD